jgi:hypothetical protein
MQSGSRETSSGCNRTSSATPFEAVAAARTMGMRVDGSRPGYRPNPAIDQRERRNSIRSRNVA